MNTPITRVGDKSLVPLKPRDRDMTSEKSEPFNSVLKKFVEDVDSLQNNALESVEKLTTGEITDVHDVMIAVEEANTAMEFMLEIRNKIVEAYQEIMRMPV